MLRHMLVELLQDLGLQDLGFPFEALWEHEVELPACEDFVRFLRLHPGEVLQDGTCRKDATISAIVGLLVPLHVTHDLRIVKGRDPVLYTVGHALGIILREIPVAVPDTDLVGRDVQ